MFRCIVGHLMKEHKGVTQNVRESAEFRRVGSPTGTFTLQDGSVYTANSDSAILESVTRDRGSVQTYILDRSKLQWIGGDGHCYHPPGTKGCLPCGLAADFL